MRLVNGGFGFGSAHTNAKLTPFPTGTHGNAELTRARHQAAATTTTTVSPAQHLRSPAAGQPRRPIRRPRHSAIYLRSSYQKAEYRLRPMQVCSSPLPVLRFIADLCHPPRSRKVRCNRIPGADKVLSFFVCLYCPHLTTDIPARRSSSVM